MENLPTKQQILPSRKFQLPAFQAFNGSLFPGRFYPLAQLDNAGHPKNRVFPVVFCNLRCPERPQLALIGSNLLPSLLPDDRLIRELWLSAFQFAFTRRGTTELTLLKWFGIKQH
jgi:hypothetical protein